MDDLLQDLNPSQCEAVRHVDGPLLVLAGAGSGKTRVITRRVAYLVRQGVRPENILAITFTNKAANEMRERVAALRTPPGALVATFHALCARLLRQYASQAGLDPNYSIYDRDDQLKAAKQALEQAEVPGGGNMTPGRVLGAISNAKNEMRTAQGFAELADDFYSRKIAKVYLAYEKLLAANNAVDFDDLLMRVAFLLRDYPEIRRQLGQRYRYVLIDEYQDTNHAQYVIAHAVAMGHENICATGDPDQSIYAWRGADINNILDFEKDYPNAMVIRLEENYRSYQPILSAASRLIEHNSQRKGKRLFTTRDGGDDVQVLLCDDEHAEARQIAQRIGRHVVDGGTFADIAVFYRVNSLSRVLEEALMKAGVPYAIARGTEFYNRKEIKDVLAYLKLLVNPADDISCLRIINTPTRGIGKTTIERLRAYATLHSRSLLDVTASPGQVGLTGAAQKRVAAFSEMIAELTAKAADRAVKTIMEDVVERTGLEEFLSRTDEESHQAKANVEELITAAAEFDEEDHDDPLREYLFQVSLVSDIDRFEGNPDAVTLMTLHAAKGLEFPVVFMAGCEEGLLPFQRDDDVLDDHDEKTEEERRLAFVGITRAMHKLTLTSARTRMVRGRRMSQASSRFLHELDGENVSTEDLCDLPSRSMRTNRFRGGFYQDSKQREVIETIPDSCFQSEPDEQPYPPEYEYLRVGCMVRHAKFGVGKVVKLAQPWPQTRADVLFHEFGQKRLVLAHTSLELVEPW
jgi:DNA helicase-2/ATP-dependent DNA helicase PcrA